MSKSLHKELTDRAAQLSIRIMMIPRYIENNKNFAGKNIYSLDMIPPIEEELKETEAAINGINDWRRAKKGQLTLLQLVGKENLELKEQILYLQDQIQRYKNELDWESSEKKGRIENEL